MTLRTKWTPEQIRRARQTPLKPLLEQRGCPMQELKNGNWKIYGLPADIIVKETFWVCPDTGNGGNAIDLLPPPDGEYRLRHDPRPYNGTYRPAT